MPGKVSSKSSRISGSGTRKSSTVEPSSRRSATSRVSAPYIEIPEETPDNELRTQISSIFRDSQRNTASHRKLVVNLRKIQEACCYEPTSKKNKTGAEDFDEEEFTYEFTRCVLRVMPIKKSESVGEKAIRFIGLFLRHANEKDNELTPANEEEDGVLVETPSTRLTSHLMSTILPLLTAKEKFVRFRSTQLISHIINSLDSIDDELFQQLRHGLLRRIHDKEAMVRVQAVLGLGRLAGNEAEGDADESDDESSGGLLVKLLAVLQNDPSADVRRSLLINLPILPNTLPYLLERARDQDPATRRALFSRLLPALGDFRHLSLSMREKLLRWGLRDRDENVRKAAGRLFRERWIEDCMASAAAAAETAEGEVSEENKAPNMEALLELLERIDVVNSGVENGVALEAMRGFWEGRPDFRDAVTFDDYFWDTLSAESVFIARSFNDFCRNDGKSKYEALIEEKMPEVTKLAFYLQRYTAVLVEAIKRIATQEEITEDVAEEEDTVEQEFIVEQLLHIARSLDYSDEVGRRKMFTLLRQHLAIPDLPEEVTKLTVEVLRGICAATPAGEKEFCSVVLEAVADVHDTVMDEEAFEDAEESFHSAKSDVSDDERPTKGGKKRAPMTEEEEQEKAVREIMVNMKCLHIVQCMLENVEGSLKENVDLVAMLNNLVVPAVRSHEAPVRERGLISWRSTSGNKSCNFDKGLLKALKSGAKDPEVQAAATVAVAKTLARTFVLYFDPSTAHNQGVRQTLTYFLPVYCYSRAENQDRMRGVALDAMHKLFETQDDDEDAEAEMVGLGTIGAHLVDWTDPRKCYGPGNQLTSSDDATKKAVNGDVHLDFAMDILERLNSSMRLEEKKTLTPLLAKLHISPASSEDKLRATYEEISEAVENKKLGLDATGRNALFKIHVTLGKIVNALAEKDERECPLGASVGSNGSRAGNYGIKKTRGPEVIMENPVKVERVEEDRKENAEGDDESEETIVAAEQETIVAPDEESLLEQQLQDSLVESLLDDDGDIEMGM
ncbi:hypothetical protein DID88_006209 [Monilinia fructigena]|uniref:Nuclear condensin complex subunit 3 C-terminal domain-containing protein n=1 Tax=Monilinia fructigena TaxID=38457 RepID=A0A395J758_9HELO|nr:hypothetical protein DID88_006209 [Monilinia fructigena]